MSVSQPKRIRIDTQLTPKVTNKKEDITKKPISTDIIHHETYLSIIITYISVLDIYRSLIYLSKTVCNFIKTKKTNWIQKSIKKNILQENYHQFTRGYQVISLNKSVNELYNPMGGIKTYHLMIKLPYHFDFLLKRIIKFYGNPHKPLQLNIHIRHQTQCPYKRIGNFCAQHNTVCQLTHNDAQCQLFIQFWNTSTTQLMGPYNILVHLWCHLSNFAILLKTSKPKQRQLQYGIQLQIFKKYYNTAENKQNTYMSHLYYAMEKTIGWYVCHLTSSHIIFLKILIKFLLNDISIIQYHPLTCRMVETMRTDNGLKKDWDQFLGDLDPIDEKLASVNQQWLSIINLSILRKNYRKSPPLPTDCEDSLKKFLFRLYKLK